MVCTIKNYRQVDYSTDFDECESSPCAHGTCTDVFNGYTCVCEAGWDGTECNINIDECASNPCQHGTCNDLVNAYSCSCEPGWTNDTCNQDINECATNPCQHGRCVDKVNNFTCECDRGWTGDTCSRDIDECEFGPCINGNCTNLDGGYSCVCEEGWTNNRTCNESVDDCGPSSCNHGTCRDLHNNYTCICDPGWTDLITYYEDVDCQCNTSVPVNSTDGENVPVNSTDEIDECSSNPCQHGACTDYVARYVCSCEDDWEGENCDQGPPTYSFQLTMDNREFTDQLSDPTSETFTSLASEVSQTIWWYLNRTTVGPDIISVVITGFRPGSVIVEYDVRFRQNTSVTGGEVQEAFISVLSNNTGLGDALGIQVQSIKQWSWRLKKEYDQFDPYSRRSSMESRQRKVTNPLYEGQGTSTAYELQDAGLSDFEESGLTDLQDGGLTDNEDGGSTIFHSEGGSTELQDGGSTGFEDGGSTGFEDGVLTEFHELDLTEEEGSQDGVC
uniref:Uncharacterized protein n=1 Tax=Branchiostoma floridae TaxID=7739 RepID=C3YPC5_BRAFL|eukprot:XP_002601697.1 hypothetical protein BRAFLDRAFT_94577 [Branchiostoma floridae]